jgi:hypothetical protein
VLPSTQRSTYREQAIKLQRRDSDVHVLQQSAGYSADDRCSGAVGDLLSLRRVLDDLLTIDTSTNRNWRYHKKLQMWLTKDDMMLPQPVNAGSERGFYIFFDPKTWARDRVSLQT